MTLSTGDVQQDVDLAERFPLSATPTITTVPYVDDDTAAAFQHLQNHAPGTQADPAQIRIDDPDPIVGFGLLKCLGKIDAGVVE